MKASLIRAWSWRRAASAAALGLVVAGGAGFMLRGHAEPSKEPEQSRTPAREAAQQRSAVRAQGDRKPLATERRELDGLSDYQIAFVIPSLEVLGELERRAMDTNNVALKAQVEGERIRLARAAAGLPRLPRER